jgi:hypothetical protein
VQPGRSPSLAAALPLATPGLADGQGCRAALRWHPEGEEETHARTEIRRHRRQAFSLARAVRRRREQVAAAAKVVQPVLFEMEEDSRPASERTAAGRYSEPSLFTFMEPER